MHNCKNGRVKPATRSQFWQTKRESNAARDKRNLRELKKQGWEVLTIWECQIKNVEKLRKIITEFLE